MTMKATCIILELFEAICPACKDHARTNSPFDSRVRRKANKPSTAESLRHGQNEPGIITHVGESWRESFYFPLNRAASGVNATTTSEQSRRMDENPVRLKTSPRSFCVTMAATVSHGSVIAGGVGWLPVSRRLQKLRTLSERNEKSKADSNSDLGLLSATDSNRRN